jgi:peptide chain release factor subunit 3
MDDKSVNWDKKRYDEIVNLLTPFLKKWGYNVNKDVIFCPGSGLTGHNLRFPIPDGLAPWYSGPTFFQILDELPPLNRNPDNPLRLPILAKYKDMGAVCALGKVESGTIKEGDKLMMMPAGIACTCVGVEIEESPVDMAQEGENAVIKLKGIEEEQIQVGYVLSDFVKERRCKATKQFVAQMHVLTLLEHKPLITAGYAAVLHANTCTVDCKIVKLLTELDKKTGKKKSDRPQFVKSQAVCTVLIATKDTIAVEEFKKYPQMGRFMLRDEGFTIAIGQMTVLKEAPTRKAV